MINEASQMQTDEDYAEFNRALSVAERAVRVSPCKVIGDGLLRFSLVVLHRFGSPAMASACGWGRQRADKNDVAQAQRRADMISPPYVL